MKTYCIQYNLAKDGHREIYERYFNHLQWALDLVRDCGVSDYTIYECSYKPLSNLDLLTQYSQEIGEYE